MRDGHHDRPESVDIRIETSQPGAERLSIHITPAFAEEIATAFEDAGGQVTRDILELSVPEVVQSVLEVAGPITASGAAVGGVLGNGGTETTQRGRH